MTSETVTGGCMCGAKRFRATIHNDSAYLCHCRMCQRATGSVSIAFKGMKRADLTWEAPPDHYQSSPIARRGYCAACGTSLTFEFVDGDTLDLTVASFDDPGRFRPVHHYAVESRHDRWLDTTGLPEYRTTDNPAVVDRWLKAVGKLPD